MTSVQPKIKGVCNSLYIIENRLFQKYKISELYSTDLTDAVLNVRLGLCACVYAFGRK